MSLPAESAAPASAGYELSPQQRRLWRSGGAAGSCEARAVFRLDGDLDPDRLRRALAALAGRHEILRTRFPKPAWSKMPSQVVDETPSIAWLEEPPGREPFDLDAQPIQACLTAAGHGVHRLTLRLPALAADARSFEILLPELAALYAGRAPAGEPFQAADYAAWQSELLDPEDHKGGLARAFWARHAQPALERPRDDQPVFPESIAVPLDTAVLTSLAGRTGNAVPAILLAGWAALLARTREEPTIVIGRVFDGRPFDDLAAAIGPLARALPLSLDCPGSATFAALARRAAAADAEAADFQEYGVGDGDDAGEAFAWLFEVRTPPSAVSAADIAFTLESAAAPARGALRVIGEQRGEEWTLRLEDDAGRLPQGEARRLAERLGRLLAAAAADPEARLEDLEILDDGERRALLAAAAPEPAVAPPAATIHDAFALQAARTPAAPALSCGGRRLTYAELDEESNRLAWHLRALGVATEERVALYLERSADAIVAMLAILKAGGAYVPLDPAFPRERLALMLEDAAPQAIVTDQTHAESLPPTGAARVLLDADRSAISSCLPVAPPEAAAPESLAYVLFTSGSTGRPKGVAVEHRQLLAYSAAVCARMGSPAGQVWATVTTLAADLGNTMAFPALLYGGCLEVVPQEVATDPEALASLMESASVDAIKIVPSQLQALLTGAPAAQLLPRRLLVLGGEAADWELVDRLAAPERLPAVFNHYGPTETTVGAVAGRLEVATAPQEWPMRPERPALGRPLAGSRAMVLDAGGRLAPWGLPGELCIGGAGVARGYLGRPDATAERFVPDAQGPAGSRLYRTGDRARLLADGRLEFRGRLDGQIKLRGFRIEPGEIEAALRRHAAVRDAAVIAREDTPGERRLVAYLAVRRGEEPAAAELRAFLRDKLPEYMVPAAYVCLVALPLTPNGKLDRRALPALERGGERSPFAAPRTPVEERLAEIWSQLLRVERVGIHDNFFDLGGDSILAIQTTARAARVGIALKPRDLFAHQTIAELAAAAGSPAERLDSGPAAGTFALTPIQRWFFAQGFADPHWWNQAILLTPSSPLSPRRLAAALARLVAHHDALRLRFAPGADGEWRQTYEQAETSDLLVHHDLSGLADPAEALEGAARALHASFDLGAGPLLRALLCELRDGQRLLLAAHHLVMDGVSWRVLIEDLAALIADPGAGDATAALPPRTTSFGAWSERLTELARSGRFDGELALWREMASAPPLPVDCEPTDGRPAVSSSAVATAVLSADETRRLLQEAPAALGVDVQELLLAGLALAVSGWTGRPRLGVVVEGHGREEIALDLDLSRTIGWFTTHHPVCLDLGERPDDPPAVARAVADCLRRIPHRGLGYGVLRYLSPAGEELARLRPPDLSFNYLGQLDGDIDGGGAGALGRATLQGTGPARSPRGHRERLFNVGAHVLDGRLHLTWGYSVDRHRPATAERLVADFAAALGRLVGGREEAAAPIPGFAGDLLARIARQVGTAKERLPDAG